MGKLGGFGSSGAFAALTGLASYAMNKRSRSMSKRPYARKRARASRTRKSRSRVNTRTRRRRRGSGRSNGQTGNVFSGFKKIGRVPRFVRTLVRFKAPLFYNTNGSGAVSANAGYQGIAGCFTLASSAILRNGFDKFTSLAKNGSQYKLPNDLSESSIYYEGVRCVTSWTNTSNVSAILQLYHIVPRRDTTDFSPVSFWDTGDDTNDVSSIGPGFGITPDTLGSTPFMTQAFTMKCLVLAVKKYNLDPGQTISHTIVYQPRRVLRTWHLSQNEHQRGLSLHVMAVVRGASVVKSTATGTYTTGPTTVGYVTAQQNKFYPMNERPQMIFASDYLPHPAVNDLTVEEEQDPGARQPIVIG